jgi:hypothetical protein
MLIREADVADWPAIWPFFHAIVAAGETFTYPVDLGEEQGREWWMLAPPDRTVVAVDEAGADAAGGRQPDRPPSLFLPVAGPPAGSWLVAQFPAPLFGALSGQARGALVAEGAS